MRLRTIYRLLRQKGGSAIKGLNGDHTLHTTVYPTLARRDNYYYPAAKAETIRGLKPQEFVSTDYFLIPEKIRKRVESPQEIVFPQSGDDSLCNIGSVKTIVATGKD